MAARGGRSGVWEDTQYICFSTRMAPCWSYLSLLSLFSPPLQISPALSRSLDLFRFLLISPDLSRSLKISPDLSKSLRISPDLSRSLQISPALQISQDLSRSLQISPDLSRSLQVSPGLSRSLQISPLDCVRVGRESADLCRIWTGKDRSDDKKGLIL